MKHRLVFIVVLALAVPLAGQGLGDPLSSGQFGSKASDRMPDGSSRTLLILKKDAEKSSEDMARVVQLATELKADIEKNEFHSVDLGSVRKAEEIIRIVRRVKSRLSRSN